MLQTNKPYIFVDLANNSFDFLINAKLNGANAYPNFQTAYKYYDSIQAGLYVIEYDLTATAPSPNNYPPYTDTFDANATKLSVRIFANRNLVGSVTVNVVNNVAPNLELNHFYTDGSKKIPYCWIKSSPVTGVEVFFAASVHSSAIAGQPDQIILQPNKHKIILCYTLLNNTGGIAERQYNLSAYDPSTYDLVEIRITDSSNARKGSGTTSQSDADSSDDN